jgi:hypothetical protein
MLADEPERLAGSLFAEASNALLTRLGVAH